MDGSEERVQTFELSKKTDTCARGVEEKEESIVLLLTLKTFQLNVFTITGTVYKDVKFIRRFRLFATNQYQFIYRLIVKNNTNR